MKQIKWLLALILLSTCLSPRAQMRQLYLDSVDLNYACKLSFYTPAEGYVAFNDWIGFTTDSGRTFTRKYIGLSNTDNNGFNINIIFRFYIQGVKAFNRNELLAYGEWGLVPTILYSADAGQHFKVIYQSQLYIQGSLSPLYGVLDMSFSSNNNAGYAIEFDRVMKTYNRGQIWGPVLTGADARFDWLEVIDENNVFVATDEFPTDRLFRTTNGGFNWQQLTLPQQGALYSTSFITASKGWLNMRYDNNSYLYYTSNGGTTWKKMSIPQVPTPIFRGKMKFINDSTGFASSGFVTYKTTDSGKIWQPVPRIAAPTYESYLDQVDMQFINANQFWVSGRQGLVEINTNAGGPTVPVAFFTIDTAGAAATGTVRLNNYSKTNYQYKWFRNGVQISTSYNTTYQHIVGELNDTIRLEVTDGVNTATATALQSFNPPPPPPASVINSFAPVTGGTGTTVTITGVNFINVSAVSFGGTAAASFTVVSPTSIRATVASGASGAVSVTTSLGTVTKPGFTFTTQLKITSFSPATGPAGTAVVINGSNFSNTPASNIVYFGAVKATVIGASATQLLVTAPFNATYQPISVTVNGLTAYSTLPFSLTYAGGGTIASTTFPYAVEHPNDSSSITMVPLDVDGDGRIDIISASDAMKTMSVLRNTSTADSFSLAVKKTFALGGAANTSVKIITTDIDSDGKPDVILNADNSTPGIAIFRNSSTSGNIAFDARRDIASTNSTPANPVDIAFADFDSDGKTDIFMVNGAGASTVFKNGSTPGNLSFTSIFPIATSAGIVSACAAADIDGDSKPDIILNVPGGAAGGLDAVYIYPNTTANGVISFAAPVVFTVKGAYSGLVIGDIDLDGKPDIASSTGSSGPGYISILRNNCVPGNISMSPSVDIAAPVQVTKLILCDINGDSKPDLVMSNSADAGNARFSVIQNQSISGNISFGALSNFGASVTTKYIRTIAAADFDGNGMPDVAVPAIGPAVSVYRNRATLPTLNICDGSAASLACNLIGNSYQWQQNTGSGFSDISNSANVAGVNNAILQLNNIPVSWNGYQYRCIVNGDASLVITIKVNAVVSSSVSITSTAVDVCRNRPPTFTATPVNGGPNPRYKWLVNVSSPGITSSNTFTPDQQMNGNNNTYRVVLLPDFACASPATDTSNGITVAVTQTVDAIVSIVPSTFVICPNEPVTFRAININGGTSPSFQWYQGFKPVGTDSSGYTTNNITINGTPIEVVMTSSIPCATTQPYYRITMTVMNGAPSVSIATPNTTICAGANVTFTSVTQNTVSGYTVQWRKNGIVVSTGNTYTTNTLLNSDIISASLNAPQVTCSPGGPYSSNNITMTVTSQPSLSIAGNTTVNTGQQTVLTTTATNSGLNPVFQWQDSTDIQGWLPINGAVASSLSYAPAKTGNKVRCLLTSTVCGNAVTITSQALQFTVNTVTSIGTVPASSYGIRWSPNPARTTLSVQQLRLSDHWERMDITAADGRQQIITQELVGRTTVDININKLPAGIYIAILKSRTGKRAYFTFIKI